MRSKTGHHTVSGIALAGLLCLTLCCSQGWVQLCTDHSMDEPLVVCPNIPMTYPGRQPMLFSNRRWINVMFMSK
ncbi:hypothetical protein K470DRAFT_172836 [Piedraia hortae CBS 480.64]|uniref:Uncharacterized protein n=1 Tax=Piedraia hortae CBS 480.64 TaxID=1314780 RepID=A0A6A7BQ40_9PEZI|nr:hypothetical protein K470DRAFT_172836 [Piedraia hortae CBS 480.64]